ncbi:MAG: hypothetical protein JW807_16900 [Spirochaetes bacterium]|nr:hypothetical protein [Spirochaetota bacterium]
MDVITVFGITWHKASVGDILVLIAVLLVPVVIIVFVKLYQNIRKRKIHEEQLFLFKMKRLGLSNFQTKIVDKLIEILGLSNPNRLLENPELFERAIGRFLTHVRSAGESADSLAMMCRDITTIHDKLYYHLLARKPLRGVDDIGDDQLIYFAPGGDKVFLGKIVSRNTKNFFLKIFGDPGGLAEIPEKKMLAFCVFRLGDAEYEFVSPINGRNGATLSVGLPTEIVMKEEARHPYIEVIIPAQISREEKPPTAKQIKELEEQVGSEEGEESSVGQGPGEKKEAGEDSILEDKTPCTIYKLNDYEAVLRLQERLDYRHRYLLEFTAMDFNFRIPSRILASKTVEEGATMYYTVKFEGLSPGANNVLKKYMYEHL